MQTENPYVNVEITDHVRLVPNQLNNNLYSHLKNNFEKKFLNRCYKDNGYITRVHEIKPGYTGLIRKEELHGVTTFKLTAICRICCPQRKMTIAAVIVNISDEIINARNGPINITIRKDRISATKFQVDNSGAIFFTKPNGAIVPLKQGVIVNVTLTGVIPNMNSIFAMATLNRIATTNEVKLFETNESEVKLER